MGLVMLLFHWYIKRQNKVGTVSCGAQHSMSRRSLINRTQVSMLFNFFRFDKRLEPNDGDLAVRILWFAFIQCQQLIVPQGAF